MATSQQSQETFGSPALAPEADVSAFWEVLKPRVMSLVIFTALVGLLAAPGHIHPLLGFAAILFIAIGAGASGALNMWYEADIDARMARTKNRPIPAGKIDRGSVLGYGLGLSIASVAALGLFLNVMAAALLAFTIFFYVVVYTMWLKPRTPQNIVIGGLAGALPPVVGWAAVTGSLDIEPIILCAITFAWTPPHFWALALFTGTDYKAAGIPMLHVVAGEKATRLQIFLYSIVLLPIGALPALIGWLSPVYGAISVVLGAVFLWLGYKVYREDGETAAARRLFRFSLIYLFVIYLAVLGESLVKAFSDV